MDKSEVGGKTIRLQTILTQMSCNDVLEWVGEEVLKEYKNLVHNSGLQAGDRSVHQVGAQSNGEAAMDPAGAQGGKGVDNDDDKDEPAETAVCAFVANSLHKGGGRGGLKPLQQDCKKKKEPRRVGDPPLSFGNLIRAHPQGCLVCYGRSCALQHDHGTDTIHQAHTEAYKKAHGTKKCTSARIREARVEVSKEKLSKGMMVRRAWGPKQDKDKHKEKDKKSKGRWKKKGDAVAGVAGEEDTPTTDAP